MTETTKTIFEKYQIRKTKPQKEAFRNYLTEQVREYGYSVKEEKGSRAATNVIIGNPDSADVIYSAHYDTCAIMPLPNFITPKCFSIYLLYQLVLTTIMFIIPFLIMFVGAPIVLERTGSQSLYTATMMGGYALLWAILFVAINGPANKNTANDNTSGVTLLINIMKDLPEEKRNSVAFIFFDMEEKGLVGSKAYKQMHKNIAKNKLLVNFDCVSDGNNILFAMKKGAAYIEPELRKAFLSNEKYNIEIASKGVFYPSDQRNFECGIGVAALRKSKSGILYMNRIHTKRDTVYNEDNIEFLKEGAIKLVNILSEEKVAQ